MSPIQPLNQLTAFPKIGYENYIIEVYPNIVFSNSLVSNDNMLDARPYEVEATTAILSIG
jgi:hypothetical protein